MAFEYTQKLFPSSVFPKFTLKDLAGNNHTLGEPQNGADWQLVLIYRGQHCPLCTRYLNELESFKEELAKIGVDIIAASGDSQEQLTSHMPRLTISFPITYGLSLEQMKELGLFISNPRSEQETDHPFAEPGLFVVNQDGKIQVIDISNNPFVRPDLTNLVNGLSWIRNPNNNYPIRGTYK